MLVSSHGYRLLSFVLAAAVIWLLPHPAHAGLCWGGHPSPRCHHFLLTEFTVGRGEGEGEYEGEDPLFTECGVAWMVNTTPDRALGGGILSRGSVGPIRCGPSFRYRKWLTPSLSVDLAPSIMCGGSKELVFPSPAADLSVSYKDLIGLTLGSELLRHNDDAHVATYVKVRFGRWLAPATFVLTWIAMASTGYGAP